MNWWEKLLKFLREWWRDFNKPTTTTTLLPSPPPPKPPPPTTTSTTPEPQPQISEILKRVFELHNEHRRNLGVRPLKLNGSLIVAAQDHANWMAKSKVLSHTDENGNSVGERVNEQGYQWTAVGENIANGFRTAQQVINGWMSSSGHRNNILRTYYEDIGLGLAYSDSGLPYWAVNFGRKRATAMSIPKEQKFVSLSGPIVG